VRAVVQRIGKCEVRAGGETRASTGHGLLVFLGVTHGDEEADAGYLARKIASLRIFQDNANKMNLSVRDVAGSICVVSQFTLLADARRGNRPSYSNAADPDVAENLYRRFSDALEEQGIAVQTGVFGAYMQVDLVNDGPVTILLDSKKLF
jgi:D-tyrosyl-tRNA(Tyr) deacylase